MFLPRENQDLELFQHVGLTKKRGVYIMSIVRKKRHEIPPMSNERAEEIRAMSDESIDFSDIPELDENFFKKAKLVKREPSTKLISIRVDTDVLRWFRQYAEQDLEEKRYQTHINDVLRTYVSERKSESV